MLFNSYEFIFAFLPLTILLVWLFGRYASFQAVVCILVLASLFFYGWWNPAYLVIILVSMVLNYQLGKRLSKSHEKITLYIGVFLNLLSLGYFKYTDFVLENVNLLLDSPLPLPGVVLPLAISFFTFQQIAYLVDSYRGETVEKHPLDYALFVTFFPQLIAGPIVHHKEMLPQFANGQASISARNLGLGLSIFALGLFKKAVLADGVAGYANVAFANVDNGITLDFFAAWAGALAYTFQLYFDFSGYSDMAIGLARMFGIILPLNFYSPYKSVNISEFWRRWHMTLSRFLRDYLYIALGGNRAGNFNRYRNLFLTMVIGGIWHGAGWNFLIWGALHGSYLMIFHAWRYLCPALHALQNSWARMTGWAVTFVGVIVGWVFFRAVTFDGAMTMLTGMFGGYGVSIPQGIWTRLGDTVTGLLSQIGITESSAGSSAFVEVWMWNIFLLVVVLMMPNTQDIFSRVAGSLSKLSYDQRDTFWPGLKLVSGIGWKANTRWALISAILFVAGVLTLSQVSEFLYFQFQPMNYLTRLALFIVLVFALIGGFNFLVDPYGFYWSPALKGFNQQKTQADERVREVTPYRALALQPDTVLIGNSRVQLGIAAESKLLEGRKAYNLSLPGAGLSETLRHALSQARYNPNLTTLIIALDYRYFLHNYSQSPGPWSQEELLNTITQPPESTVDRIKRIYPAVFSLDTLFDSVRTVVQQGGTYNNITRLGSNTGGYYLDAIKAEGKKRFYKHQFDGLYMRFGRQHLTYESDGKVHSMDLLTTFLDETRKAHPLVNIYFFINPYHQSYWQVIYRSGHWGSYLKWKRDLARIAEKYPEYPVYDFSLPSQQTLEPLNYAQDKQLMTWYWEPAHYRPALGDEVLKALLGHATTSTTGNWPVRLDAHTIEKAIKQSIDGLSQSD